MAESDDEATDESLWPRKLVINELLSYLQFHKAYAVDILQGAISKFYVPLEVEVAKDILWANLQSSANIKKPVRKHSSSRSATDANITDMIQTMKTHNFDHVHFVALNLDRLPKWAPDELSLVSLATRVAHLEAEILCVKEDFTKMTNKSRNYITEPIYSDAPITSSYPKPQLNASPESTQSDHPISSLPSGQAAQNQQSNYSGALSRQPPPKMPTNNDPGHSVLSVRSQNTKLNKPPSNAIKPKNARPKPTVGKKKDLKIKGESRRTDIFMYRINNETEDADVRNLFFNAGILVYEFHKVSHENSRFKSFRITIPLSDYDKVCNPDFLPEEVMCRRFYRPRKRRLSEHSDGAPTICNDDLDEFF